MDIFNIIRMCNQTVSSEISGVGDRGREPGILWGWRGTGDGRRKGGKRERIQKGKLSLFVTAYHPVKETYPTTFFDFHLTFSEA